MDGGGLQHVGGEDEVAQRVVQGWIALGPPTGGRQGNHRAGATARRQPQRQIAAQRVAGDVDDAETGGVHRLLDRVEHRRRAPAIGDRRAAGVPRERRRQHLVAALQRSQYELPRAPCVGEAMQQQQRRALATVMRRGEAGL
jgi:hypothetical protein